MSLKYQPPPPNTHTDTHAPVADSFCPPTPPSHCSILHSPRPPGPPQGSGCEMHNQCNIHGLNFFFFFSNRYCTACFCFFFFFLCVFSPHFAFNLFVTCRHSTLCGYLFIYCLCLKPPPPFKICISFLVFGLHSYNLFLHFFFFF